jgi:S-formylglutathione hydrolase FrmB
MLHGLGGDETNWLKLGNLAEAADAMGLQAIVVMPDGDASFYADAVTGVPYDTCMNGQHFLRSHPKERTCVKGSAYETYIVKDLLAEIGARYRVIDDRKARAIGGLSMGGYGALMLGMRHKNVFSSVASHSGVDALLYVGPHPYEKGKVVLLDDVKLWGSNIEPLGGWVRLIFGPDVANWRAHDPAHLARSLKNGELAIYLDCGTEDDFSLHNGAQYLDEVLTSAGVAHDFTLLPGRHNFTFWKERIDDSLAFHARQFEAAGY